MTFVIIFLIAYLIGSIPFGLILVRLAGKGDIRKIGSGNIGATNVLRTGSKKLAALTLLLDGGKGFVAVWLMQSIMQRPPSDSDTYITYWAFLIIVSVAVLIGHIFPVWLRFKGGKGVATALGVFWALWWPVGFAACLAWLIIAFCFKYSSLAALVAMSTAPITAAIGCYYSYSDPELHAKSPVLVSCILISLLVILRHHANIHRLLNGTEPKIGKTNATP